VPAIKLLNDPNPMLKSTRQPKDINQLHEAALQQVQVPTVVNNGRNFGLKLTVPSH
jgi:hypothetical protein